MAITPKALSLETFLQRPEEEPPLEYIDGVVCRKVSPKYKHGKLQAKLVREIDNYAEPRRLASAVTEVRTTFGGASVVPDVSVFRWDRLQLDDHGEYADDVYAPPDIAVEIASPGQSMTALVRRCLWYVQNGVSIALLVVPADQSVLGFRPGEPPAVWEGEDRLHLDTVLPDFELRIKDLFRAIRPERGAESE